MPRAFRQIERMSVPSGGAGSFTVKSVGQVLESLSIWAVSGPRSVTNMTFQPRVNGQTYGAATAVAGAQVAHRVLAGGNQVPLVTQIPLVLPADRFEVTVDITQPVSDARLDDGTVFTDFTTEANNATVDDVELLPAGGSALNDAFYIGAAAPFACAAINVSTAGVGTWTLAWEYWNGAWTAIPGVADGTSAFTAAGLGRVVFTPPVGWLTTTVDGAGPFYFIRARVTVGDAAPTRDPTAATIVVSGSVDEAVTLYASGLTGDS